MSTPAVDGAGELPAAAVSTPRSSSLPDYYANARADLYSFARSAGMWIGGDALCVGCAAGRDAEHLRALGAIRVHGIEPVSAVAKLARQSYDQVFSGPVEDYPWGATVFDVIVFADVLEHLVDPAAALRAARAHLSEAGQLLISVPNVRHLSVIWSLAVKGDWRYGDSGILDRTHLRFFTSRSFRRLMGENGLEVTTFARSGLMATTRSLAKLLPFTGEFTLSHLFYVARPA